MRNSLSKKNRKNIDELKDFPPFSSTLFHFLAEVKVWHVTDAPSQRHLAATLIVPNWQRIYGYIDSRAGSVTLPIK